MMNTLSHTTPSAAARPDMAHAPREAAAIGARLNTGELFNGAREILIDHNGREYRLRITQQGKLLLTA